MSLYEDWIVRYVSRFESSAHTLGKCQEAVKEMKREFPELEVKKGHVHCAWGKRGHWWLEASDGEIVDPTATQFTSGIDRYEEYFEGDPIRVGKCMYCGTEIWGIPDNGRKTFCNKECEEDFATYLNGERA